MAVNNNFYKTLNELVQRATNGTVGEIVDYNSFIETGKKLTDMVGNELRNNFVNALMNKIGKTLMDIRSYDGAYNELVRGAIPYGNTIELIMCKFYEARVAPFVELKNGDSVDQWVIAKPEADVNYFVDTNAFSIPVTIQRDQLIKAFTSPYEMDTFISGIMTYVRNSIELRREAGRIGMVADWVDTLDSQEVSVESTDENRPAMKYNLLSIYKAHTGADLSADNCLYNEEFVKFAVATIIKVMNRMKKVSENYNLEGYKTFTPDDKRHLFVNSILSSAISTYVPRPYLNNEEVNLTDYIEVPYWQNELSPLTVSAAHDGEEVESSPVVCAILDKFALGEYLKSFTTETTPYNAGGKYWNVWSHIETRYIKNRYANSVIFTLA